MNKAPTVIALKKNQVLDTLNALKEMAEKGEISNIVFAGFMNDGNIITSHVNATLIEQQTLISYLQTAVVRRIVMENDI